MCRKIMNRFALLLLLTAAVALMTAGCGKKTDPAGTGQSTGEETVPSGAENESTEDPRIMPELQSEDDIGIFCGTVKDAGMNTMVVANKEYPDGVVFAKEDAAVSLADGLLLEHEVTVFYRGKIDLSSSSGVKAELVRDPRDGDKDCRAGEVSGEVLGVGMSVITIKTGTGTEVSFEQEPKPVNLTSGPLEGDKVTIFYSHKPGETIYVPELIQ